MARRTRHGWALITGHGWVTTDQDALTILSTTSTATQRDVTLHVTRTDVSHISRINQSPFSQSSGGVFTFELTRIIQSTACFLLHKLVTIYFHRYSLWRQNSSRISALWRLNHIFGVLVTRFWDTLFSFLHFQYCPAYYRVQNTISYFRWSWHFCLFCGCRYISVISLYYILSNINTGTFWRACVCVCHYSGSDIAVTFG